MSTQRTKHKKLCASPLHSVYARVLLIIAAFSVFTLSLGFLFGFNYFSEFELIMPPTFRIFFGVLYAIFSLSILHFILSYYQIRKKQVFVCYHCGHKTVNLEK